MPLEIAAGVAGFVALGITVTQGLIKYYEAYSNQSTDLEGATKKLQDFLRFVQALGKQLEARPSRGNDFDSLDLVQECIEDCGPTLESLEQLLNKLGQTALPGTGSGWKEKGRKLAYPFRKKDLTRLEEDLDEMTEQLQKVMQLLQGQDLSNVRDTVDDTKELLELVRGSQLDGELHQWLKAPDSTTEYYSHMEKRHPDTGLWLVKSTNFKDWLQSPGAFRWIVGFAGSGKSVLCSTAIDATYKYCKSRDGAGIAFFYFTHNNKDKQDSSALLRGLVLQLSSQTSDLKLRKGHGSPSRDVLIDMLVKLAGAFGNIYVFIDALDESPSQDFEDHRSSVLEIIVELRKKIRNLHLLVTSRGYEDIREELNPLGAWAPNLHEEVGAASWEPTGSMKTKKQLGTEEEIVMGDQVVDQDIVTFVRHQLEHDKKLRGWSNFRDRIATALSTRAKGMFRLAECHLNELKRCPKSEAALESALASLPKTLYGTYERMLDNISESSRIYARQVLMLVCVAKKPLRVTELADAVAVRMDGTRAPWYDPKLRIHDHESLVEMCPGMIAFGPAIRKGWSYRSNETDTAEAFERESTVQLAHYSVFEFLTDADVELPEDLSPGAKYRFNLTNAHTYMASLCLGYIMSPCTDSQITFRPFLQYAADEWPDHYRTGEDNQSSRDLILQLFFGNHEYFPAWSSAVQYRKHRQYPCGWLKRVYLSCRFGLSEVLRILLGESGSWSCIDNENISTSLQKSQKLFKRASRFFNFSEQLYEQPLCTACRFGNEACVKVLTAHAASLTTPTPVSIGWRFILMSALHTALKFEHSRIASILVDLGAEVHQTGKAGDTALHLAASNGDLSVVRLLIASGADPNAKNCKGRTPLHKAAREGHLRVVKFLVVNCGARLKAADIRNQDALYHAACQGCEDVVSFLIRHGATNLVDALEGACGGGHLGVVQTLANRIRCQGLRIRCSALWEALRLRDVPLCQAVIRILLENGVPLYKEALVDAVRLPGRDGIAQELIDYGAPLNPRRLAETPLQAATLHDEVTTLRLFLDRGADVNGVNCKGRTALHTGARRILSNSKQVMSTLLQAGATVDARDESGMTPLQIACRCCRDRFDEVKALVDYGADIQASKNSSSPLHEAVRSGRLDVVQLLVEKGASFTGGEEKYGSVMHAIARPLGKNEEPECDAQRQIDVAQLLLDNGADINAPSESFGTPIQHALHCENLQLARFMLENGAKASGISEAWMYRLAHDHDTPNAAMSHERFEFDFNIGQLLQRGTSMSQIDGQVAFQKAHKAERWDLCSKILKACPAVGSSSECSLIALKGASLAGDLEALQLLVERDAGVRIECREWEDALIAASSKHRTATIRFLIEQMATINICATKYCMALQAACFRHRRDTGAKPARLESVKLLLEHYASSKTDWTPIDLGKPLELALESQDAPLVHLLLDQGATVTREALRNAFNWCKYDFDPEYQKAVKQILKSIFKGDKKLKEELHEWTIEAGGERWQDFFWQYVAG